MLVDEVAVEEGETAPDIRTPIIGEPGSAPDSIVRARSPASVISQYDAPHRFVDEQVSGPFRRWWHEHRFETVAGGTLMTDVVEFESPVGPVGRRVNALVLTRYLTKLLEQRNAWLVEALATPEV